MFLYRQLCLLWLRQQDSNLRMRESKSLALPLGYAAMLIYLITAVKKVEGTSAPSTDFYSLSVYV